MEEESVDQLLEKLAKKGKKVKIINESDSFQNNDDESPLPNPTRKGVTRGKPPRQHQQDNNSIEEAEDEEEDGNHKFGDASLPPTVKKVNAKRTIIRDSSEK